MQVPSGIVYKHRMSCDEGIAGETTRAQACACVMLSPMSHTVLPWMKGHRSQGVSCSMLRAH